MESSGLLAWVFEQERAESVARAIGSADEIVTSEITVLEAERALVRAEVMRWRSPAEARALRSQISGVMSHWHVMHVASGTVGQAGERFPVEPIRTLDALHVAAAVEAREAVPDLAVLSLDRRVRDNAAALGFEVLPVAL